MQKDIKEYGADVFSFEVLEYLKPKEDMSPNFVKETKDLLDKWLAKIQPFGDNGYN